MGNNLDIYNRIVTVILEYWNPYRQILNTFFLWLSGIVTDKDVILVDFPGRKAFFYFEFPLRYGDKPKKMKALLADKEITFIIRRTIREKLFGEAEWVKIFGSSEIEVFENKKRVNGTPPLRWGLNENDKRLALKIARDALESFLEKGERLAQNYFTNLNPYFYLRTDLDVALWVGGYLRGSSVVENRNLGEGIAEAVIMASRDSRFKPLVIEELPHTRIEITIMHNLHISLSVNERKRNVIYPEKGYLLQHRLSKGWYLPEVFNVRHFRNLEEFLINLAQEKARLDRSAIQKADVFIFEVDDFIESTDRSSALVLHGPIVKSNSLTKNSQIINQKLRAAADWLCHIQESDGNLPPIISSLTGKQTQIDWPRLAFTAWALAEFGKVINEKKYTATAEKSFEYLKKFLLPNPQFKIPSYELTLSYLGQLALVLKKPKDATDVAIIILNNLNQLNFEPILFAQVASFLKVLPKSYENFLITFEKLALILKENFEKNLRDGHEINLAVWAELVNTFTDTDKEFSDRVVDWMKKQQLPSGAFPESTTSNFAYTRGTGKILEVLALEPHKNKESIKNVLAWLLEMQYDEENMFFIPKEIQLRIVGGFRHDHFNQEAWIDAAGHVLLGAARLV